MLNAVSSLTVHRLPFKAMGSACEVVLAAATSEEAKVIAQAAITEVLRIERKYSRYTSDSVIAKINQQAAKTPVACDAETWSLFQFASQLFEKAMACLTSLQVCSGGLGISNKRKCLLLRSWNTCCP